MRRLICFFVILMALSFLFVGCDSTYVNHPISGNVYYKNLSTSTSKMVIYLYFYSNGRFDQYTFTSSSSTNYDGHFRWKVERDKIIVSYDNSTYWKAAVRGTIKGTYIYNPLDNTITDSSTNTSYTFYRKI